MSGPKTKLTPIMLEAMIDTVEFFQPENTTLTICVLVLKNGCTVTGTSNVIDAANFDAKMGEQTARANATNKIWELEGYALKRDMNKRHEEAARMAHEINRAYCIALGDVSHLPWDQAPDWQKESAIMGVKANAENPDMTPEDNHQNWFDHKKSEGWIYGEVKDEVAKTHPCMVSYGVLPKDQRVKDSLFKAAVTTSLGY